MEMIGKKFNKLTVISFSHIHKQKKMWLCLCECGNETLVSTSNLRNNGTKSCGCLRVIASRALHTKHGLREHELYSVWCDMKKRCYNVNSVSYKNYGYRGITVCDRWLNSFKNFLIDMGERPAGMTLDRINVDGNYEPNNCRWTTTDIQNVNQRVRKNNTSGYKGVYKHIDKWESTITVNKQTIHLGCYISKKSAVTVRNRYIIDNNLELSGYKIQEWQG
jgi:hypothetical protein